MKASQQSIFDAILLLAEEYDLKGYKEQIAENKSLPTLVRLIVYDLFVLKFNEHDCTDNSYSAYILIRNYAEELKEQGEVKFLNNEYD